jgi:hypothetical protein
MWLVGGLPRVMDIFVIGMVGLLLRREKAWVRFAAFTLLVTASVILYVSTLFKLSLTSILSSLGFVAELRPAASPEYFFGGLLLVAVFALAGRFMRARQDFDAPLHIVTAGAMLLATCALDGWLTADATRHSKPATFSSAATQTGFEALAEDGNHLVIVMVEALGLPNDPALRARLMKRWQRSDIAGRYQVQTGSTPFWGSTTYGEMRELCGRWGDYHPLKSAPDPTCLPARLAARGYQTSAVHGFDQGFFERTAWYPNAGFQQLIFRDQLARSGAATCGGVFPGACDRDIPARIGERLKRAETKQFVYWLTLSSHLPVPKSDTLGTDKCARSCHDLPAVQPLARGGQVASGRADRSRIAADRRADRRRSRAAFPGPRTALPVRRRPGPLDPAKGQTQQDTAGALIDPAAGRTAAPAVPNAEGMIHRHSATSAGDCRQAGRWPREMISSLMG